MNKYTISFNGTCDIEAATWQEAEKQFWELVNADKALPHNTYEVDNTILTDVREQFIRDLDYEDFDARR